MIRLFVAGWALVGCQPAAPLPEDPDTSVELRFDATPATAGRTRFDDITLVVERITIDASGPEGPVSVVLLAHSTLRPLAPSTTLEFRLSPGDYGDAVFGLTLGETGRPAISATGFVADEDDDDDDLRAFRLEIDLVDLQFDLPALAVEREPWSGTVGLHPVDWLDGLPLATLPDPLVISPGTGTVYDRLVENVRAAVDLSPPADVRR